MTTWVAGNTITSTWMNSVEKVLALGTFGATTSPRLTITPNQTYDISGLVAADIRWNGNIVTTGSQQYEALSFRSLTSASSGTSYATCMNFLHTATPDAGSSSYAIIGSVIANGGAGKINPFYGRASSGSTFTGVMVAGQFGCTYDTGASISGVSSVVNIERSGTNVNPFPIGLYFYTNSAGSIINNIIAVDPGLQVGINVLQWAQRSGTTANFLQMLDPTLTSIWRVSSAAVIDWTGGTAAQLATAGTTFLKAQANQDITIGKTGAATADTAGHMYIQAVAGAPTGVPTGYAGYVPMRYDSTNNKLYVYNAGWKTTTVFA